MTHYNVVAAVIVHNGHILCMQKGKTKFPYTSFKYEFPGGKIEPGETPAQALQRELREEMAYDIQVGEPLTTVDYTYPDFSITMQAFFCTADTDYFVMKEHAAFRWLLPDRLDTLDWAAADVAVVKALQAVQ